MSRILTIGDLHEPVSRIGYLEFCQDLYDEWDCNKVVFIGDVVDWHAISFHIREPGCPGPKDEYELAKLKVQRWIDAFPKADVCIGNHDERPVRLARTVSIPDFMVTPYDKLWGTKKWKWDFNHIIDDVLYRHGTGDGGIHPAWTIMNRMKMSVVMGHCHSRSGVKFSANIQRRFFGVDVGCGIDEKAWQFAYGRDIAERPLLSAALIIDGHP